MKAAEEEIRAGIGRLRSDLLAAHRRGIDIAEAANRMTSTASGYFPPDVEAVLFDMVFDLVDGIRDGSIQ